MSQLTPLTKHRKRLLWPFACAAIAATLTLGNANAAPVLADMVVDGYVGLGFASNTVFLTTPGSSSLPAPNNFGTATIAAVAGSSPIVSVIIDSQEFQSTAGGGGAVTLTYHMMYFNADAAPGSTVLATINTSNSLSQSGSATARTLMTIGTYVAYECLTGAGIGGCNGSALHDGAPFVSGPITLVQNQDYLVRLQAAVTVGVGSGSAFIDPWFSAPLSGGGEFIFSAGITAFNPVPLPAALPLFTMAFGALGLLARKRKKLTALAG